MSFIRRAVLYCIRQRVKSFILFCVFLLIATFMLTGIAIRDASVKQSENLQTAVGGKILLDLDSEGHMGEGQQNQWGTVYGYNGDLITQQIVDAIAKVDGVIAYNSEDKEAYYGAGVDFQYLPADLALSCTQYGDLSSYTATLSSEKCSQFENGNYKLIEGRHINPDDSHSCLFSKELADFNKLSVGDKVKMYSLDSDSIVEFELVGIFDGAKGTEGNALTVNEIPANCGYIDYATMFELFKEDLNGYQQLSIYVADPVHVETVYEKISALPELKGKTLKLSIDTEEYNVISSPFESLQKLINALLVIILLISVVVLTLLLTIWIRGRKAELGILLSIGRSKGNIVMQLFGEIFIVAAASFAAAMPFSCLTVDKTAEFLASRVTKATTNLIVQVEAQDLLLLYLLGIFIIVVAVIASSWTVVCSKPRDILTKIS